jgi:hypothetical protein
VLAAAVLTTVALAAGPANASVSIGCAGEKVRVTVTTTGSVRHVDLLVDGRRVARDTKKPFTKTLKKAGGKDIVADVRFRDGRSIRLGRRAPRC